MGHTHAQNMGPKFPELVGDIGGLNQSPPLLYLLDKKGKDLKVSPPVTKHRVIFSEPEREGSSDKTQPPTGHLIYIILISTPRLQCPKNPSIVAPRTRLRVVSISERPKHTHRHVP